VNIPFTDVDSDRGPLYHAEVHAVSIFRVRVGRVSVIDIPPRIIEISA
jgi:hypothetical protein